MARVLLCFTQTSCRAAWFVLMAACDLRAWSSRFVVSISMASPSLHIVNVKRIHDTFAVSKCRGFEKKDNWNQKGLPSNEHHTHIVTALRVTCIGHALTASSSQRRWVFPFFQQTVGKRIKSCQPLPATMIASPTPARRYSLAGVGDRMARCIVSELEIFMVAVDLTPSLPLHMLPGHTLLGRISATRPRGSSRQRYEKSWGKAKRQNPGFLHLVKSLKNLNPPERPPARRKRYAQAQFQCINLVRGHERDVHPRET